MTPSSENIRRLRSVKAAYEAELMRRANVVGVGIGMRVRNGQPTDEPVIVVSVTHKVPPSLLRAQDVIPAELDGVPVDVQDTGSLTALVERVRQAKQVHASQLLRKRNVVGVGLGYKMV
ncbi:MAG: hypothetical protein GX601_20475, partial [Anaerolineales bacterium]|nr:hypothetical protein [Anaerolineales bacterium]